MKLISIKRETKLEKRFAPEMGLLKTKVTYIKKEFLKSSNIPGQLCAVRLMGRG